MITLWTPGPEGTDRINAVSALGSKTEDPDAPSAVVSTQPGWYNWFQRSPNWI